MKTRKQPLHSQALVGFLAAVLLITSPAQAASAVRWEDLPKKIGHSEPRGDGQEDRIYRIVTKDGDTHEGRSISFLPNRITLGPSGVVVDRDDVAEIRVHLDGRLQDAIWAPGKELLRDPFRGLPSDRMWPTIRALLLLPIEFPAFCVITAASAPIVLPVQGVKRLLPDKVIKVAP